MDEDPSRLALEDDGLVGLQLVWSGPGAVRLHGFRAGATGVSDPNADILDRGPHLGEPSKVCADCGGRYEDGEDFRCRACLRIGRYSPQYRRAVYRFGVWVPARAILCRCNDRLWHTHDDLPSQLQRYVTRAGAEAAVELYSPLAKERLEVEEL